MTDKEVIKELNGIKELLMEASMDERDRRRIEALNCAATILNIHSKKYGDTIHLHDEVYSEDAELKFIITRIKEDGTYEGICTDGACYNGLPDDIEKTGRSFPELAEVLKRMNKDD